MAYLYQKSAGFGVNGLEQKIVPIKGQTLFHVLSWLLATKVVTFKTSKPYLICSSKLV